MKMLNRLGLLALIGVIVVSACDDDDETGPTDRRFTATLNGANERPNPVTTTAVGTMTMTVPNTSNQMSWTLNVTNIPANDTLTLAHIHKGVADSAGSVIVNFNPAFPLTGAAVTLNGAVAVPDSVFTLIAGNRAYVNVHSKRSPGGVIRGQIVPQP